MQQYLIKWEGLNEDQATWEDTTAVQRVFPEFNLEDKVSLKGEGNVTNTTARDNEGGISGAQTGGHVAELGGERCSTRLKITNSKLAKYVWSWK